MCVSSIVLFTERLGTGRCLLHTGKKSVVGIFYRLAEPLSTIRLSIDAQS